MSFDVRDVRTTSQGETQNKSIKSDSGVKANMNIFIIAETINMKADHSNNEKQMVCTR